MLLGRQANPDMLSMPTCIALRTQVCQLKRWVQFALALATVTVWALSGPQAAHLQAVRADWAATCSR